MKEELMNGAPPSNKGNENTMILHVISNGLAAAVTADWLDHSMTTEQLLMLILTKIKAAIMFISEQTYSTLKCLRADFHRKPGKLEYNQTLVWFSKW